MTSTNNIFKELNIDSLLVARAIRYSAKQRGYQLNMTQIQKLLYIVYGTLLRLAKVRITTEHPHAWPFGPVFPRVHAHLKLWEDVCDNEYNEIRSIFDGKINQIIDIVVDTFGKETAGTLSSWSHEQGSPWALAVKRADGKWNEELNDEEIYNYFYSFITIQQKNPNG